MGKLCAAPTDSYEGEEGLRVGILKGPRSGWCRFVGLH